MKVYKEFVKRVLPTLGKNELRLCMILEKACHCVDRYLGGLVSRIAENAGRDGRKSDRI